MKTALLDFLAYMGTGIALVVGINALRKPLPETYTNKDTTK